MCRVTHSHTLAARIRLTSHNLSLFLSLSFLFTTFPPHAPHRRSSLSLSFYFPWFVSLSLSLPASLAHALPLFICRVLPQKRLPPSPAAYCNRCDSRGFLSASLRPSLALLRSAVCSPRRVALTHHSTTITIATTTSKSPNCFHSPPPLSSSSSLLVAFCPVASERLCSIRYSLPQCCRRTHPSIHPSHPCTLCSCTTAIAGISCRIFLFIFCNPTLLRCVFSTLPGLPGLEVCVCHFHKKERRK